MSVRFERSGPLTEVNSYPQWAQDMVGECEDAKQAVVDCELVRKFCERTVENEEARNFLVGLWPVIEGFPGYMARSLLKTRFGRSGGDNLARRWLVRNIRVEQNHADYWLNWAEGHGIPREEVLCGVLPPGTQVLANWCEEVSGRGTLAAGIAATNYAVEGATGEWARRVYGSALYADSFPAASRKSSLRWLQLHAAYDDEHPWEALEIVCTLLGTSPSAAAVEHITECVKRTYACMRVFADRCLRTSQEMVADPEYDSAAAA
ncbi:MAG TPA: iron-containing redox enzyme family protein [Rhodanobacteraceae bacterium]|nr:iron-containing redox enzyme family protein [Rhodanobacteraceae bacterium]